MYKLTAKFPVDEKYGLTSQIRRCAVSVAANIAEGSTRNSPKDQAHFSTMAYGSLLEILSHLEISSDLNFISRDELEEAKKLIYPLSLKINNLKNSQLKRIT